MLLIILLVDITQGFSILSPCSSSDYEDDDGQSSSGNPGRLPFNVLVYPSSYFSIGIVLCRSSCFFSYL